MTTRDFGIDLTGFEIVKRGHRSRLLALDAGLTLTVYPDNQVRIGIPPEWCDTVSTKHTVYADVYVSREKALLAVALRPEKGDHSRVAGRTGNTSITPIFDYLKGLPAGTPETKQQWILPLVDLALDQRTATFRIPAELLGKSPTEEGLGEPAHPADEAARGRNTAAPLFDRTSWKGGPA